LLDNRVLKQFSVLYVLVSSVLFALLVNTEMQTCGNLEINRKCG